jgi:hypothetical protein
VRRRALPSIAWSGVLVASLAHTARADSATTAQTATASTPEHLAQAFLQYGLAFTGEFVLAPGPICNFPGAPACILGTGGGLTVRVGRRLRGPFYFGAAYEFSKMESNQLYRLAILQQGRAEGRYYLFTGRSTEPYVGLAVGAAFYGNVWGVDTSGPLFGANLGAEFQISTSFVLGFALSYRAIFFTRFTDSAGTTRPPDGIGPSFAHLLGIDLILEARDPL